MYKKLIFKLFLSFSLSLILTLLSLCTFRTCVNGSTIHQKTKVKNGDRILWGNNHFFRINCPKQNSKIPLTALFLSLSLQADPESMNISCLPFEKWKNQIRIGLHLIVSLSQIYSVSSLLKSVATCNQSDNYCYSEREDDLCN